jgi:hypothetical protein
VDDFPLGTDRDKSIVGCPAEDGSLNDSELTSPVSTQAEVVRNPAQAGISRSKIPFAGPFFSGLQGCSGGWLCFFPYSGGVSGWLFSLGGIHVHVASGVFPEGEGGH